MKKREKKTLIVGKDDRECVFSQLNLMNEIILF
jgi:hypothetical protein